MKRNLEIDRLRAVAILLTVSAHLPGPFSIPTSFTNVFHLTVGVDLFFAISGFLMTMHLYPQISNSTNGYLPILKKFYTRRSFRLFPQACLWLLVMLIGSLTWPQVFSDIGTVVPQVATSLGFVQNVAINYLPYHPMLHVYWSLSLEEQFYVLLPLLLIFLKRKGTIAVAVIYLVSRILIDPSSTEVWAYRLDALFFGCLLAFFYQSNFKTDFEPKWLSGNKFAAFLVSVAAVLMLVIVPGALWQTPIFYFLQGVLPTVILFFAVYGKGYSLPVPWGIAHILDWIGTRSYALYLIHNPAFYITWRILPQIPYSDRYTLGVFLIASFALMAVLAELSYQIVEKPLRNVGKRVAEGREGRTKRGYEEATAVVA